MDEEEAGEGLEEGGEEGGADEACLRCALASLQFYGVRSPAYQREHGQNQG